MSICGGIAGLRGSKPRGAYIHNDAGSSLCNANHYNIWLRTHDLESGFAHAYVGSDYTLISEDENFMAWHCGNTYGNSYFWSVECCQSFGDLNTFKRNEDNALKLVAQKFKQWGLKPNANTVKLHREVFATACPHRSVEIHGGLTNTKNYFIQQIAKYMGENVSVETSSGGIKPTQTVINNILGGSKEMQCTFTIDNGACVYWFHDSIITGFAHPDELKIVNDIYRANYGKDIPSFKFSSKAPYYVRLLNAIQRGKVTKF